MVSVVVRILGIVVCGVLGGVAAGWFVAWLELAGTWGALLAALAGMVVAGAAFAGWITLARAVVRAR